jgi:AcrR family transcriptional regulator/DNA-binding MarR family transcriptional regulator
MAADAAKRQGAESGRKRGSSPASSRSAPEPDSRRTLLAAASRLVGERGAEAVTRESLSALAGVPPSTFDVVFAGRVDCLMAVFDDVSGRAFVQMRLAYGSSNSWLDGIRNALYALLSFLDENNGLARFLVVDSLSGEPAMLARRQRLLAGLARALDSGRPDQALDASAAPFGAEAVVGAVAAVIHGRLNERSGPPLRELGGALMAVLVLPYLGVDAARGEISRPVPRVPLGGVERSADQSAVAAVGVRMTPRTLEVLRAISASPGMNNRQVAEAAGISSSAQASRLLARLRDLGLIVSKPARARSGRAWELTGTGRWLFAEVGPARHAD